jgi:hypothetical protein
MAIPFWPPLELKAHSAENADPLNAIPRVNQRD